MRSFAELIIPAKYSIANIYHTIETQYNFRSNQLDHQFSP